MYMHMHACMYRNLRYILQYMDTVIEYHVATYIHIDMHIHACMYQDL